MAEGWGDVGGDGLTYVTTSEVPTLEHELGDDAVELAALVAEALLAGAEGAEVLGGLGDDVVEELEVDAARASYVADLPSAIELASISYCTILRLSAGSLLVTLPLASVVSSGPVQVQSNWSAGQLEPFPPRSAAGWMGRTHISLDDHVGGAGVELAVVQGMWCEWGASNGIGDGVRLSEELFGSC